MAEENKIDEFDKHKDFLQKIKNVKSQYAPDSFESTVPDEFILTMATAETGNFKFEGGPTPKEANNFFGIQAGANQPYLLSQDPTDPAKVRVFDNAEDSIHGFLELMKTGVHYSGVRDAITRGDDTINYFDYLSKYAEKPDYIDYLKDVYVTRVLNFTQPKDDNTKLMFPKRKPMNLQMNTLK